MEEIFLLFLGYFYYRFNSVNEMLSYSRVLGGVVFCVVSRMEGRVGFKVKGFIEKRFFGRYFIFFRLLGYFVGIRFFF